MKINLPTWIPFFGKNEQAAPIVKSSAPEPDWKKLDTGEHVELPHLKLRPVAKDPGERQYDYGAGENKG